MRGIEVWSPNLGVADSIEFMHSDETLKKIIYIELVNVTGLSRTFFLVIQMSNKDVVLVGGL